jgi:catechol 2,3-dioxygenase-like lactoylglutathione lyase family enzyme
MIIGTHLILSSTNADADRAFMRDVLGLSHIDAGHGWLIFALPPTEVAVHPDASNAGRELYLLTNDLDAELLRLTGLGVQHEAITDERWGIATYIKLPGGGRVGLYQPKHPLAIEVKAAPPP